jgi:serine/threonine protein phosphatase PrpC
VEINTRSNDGGLNGRRVGTRTDVGLRRERNEDFLGVQETPNGLLLVVCDGMGGHEGGDRASRLAVETFIESALRDGGAPREILARAVERANAAVYEDASRPTGRLGMGTTLVAALLSGSTATVVNVGDSRAYLFSRSRLSRITRDHSMVGELVAQGKISEEEARVHPQRNLITRALGTRAQVEPDLFDVPLADGDRLLLATDGLHGMVTDETIALIVGKGESPERTCDALVEAALAAGGDDNVTVALLAVGAEARLAAPIAEPDTQPPVRSTAVAAVGAGGAARAVRTRSRWLLPLVILTLGVAVWYFWRDTPVEPDLPSHVDSLLHTGSDSSSELDELLDTGSAQANPTLDSLIRLHTQDTSAVIRPGLSHPDSAPRRDSAPADAVTGRSSASGARRRR